MLHQSFQVHCLHIIGLRVIGATSSLILLIHISKHLAKLTQFFIFSLIRLQRLFSIFLWLFFFRLLGQGCKCLACWKQKKNPLVLDFVDH